MATALPVGPGRLWGGCLLRRRRRPCTVAVDGGATALRSYVPPLHVSDEVVKAVGRHRKLAVGKALRCRVSAVESGRGGGRGRATLNAKKSLVAAGGAPLTSYAQAADALAAARAASRSAAASAAAAATDAASRATFFGHVMAMATSLPGRGAPPVRPPPPAGGLKSARPPRPRPPTASRSL